MGAEAAAAGAGIATAAVAGTAKPAPREAHKVDFDRAVFKADYF